MIGSDNNLNLESLNALLILLHGILKDEATIEKTISFLDYVFKQPATQKAVLDLCDKLLQDPALIKFAQQFVVEVIKEQWVQDALFQAIKDNTIRTLNDPETIKVAKEFVQTILQDTNVQSNAGDALWEAMKWSVTPRFLQWKTSDHKS